MSRKRTAVSSLSGTPLAQLDAFVKLPLEFVFQLVVIAAARKVISAKLVAMAIWTHSFNSAEKCDITHSPESVTRQLGSRQNRVRKRNAMTKRTMTRDWSRAILTRVRS